MTREAEEAKLDELERLIRHEIEDLMEENRKLKDRIYKHEWIKRVTYPQAGILLAAWLINWGVWASAVDMAWNRGTIPSTICAVLGFISGMVVSVGFAIFIGLGGD